MRLERYYIPFSGTRRVVSAYRVRLHAYRVEWTQFPRGFLHRLSTEWTAWKGRLLPHLLDAS